MMLSRVERDAMADLALEIQRATKREIAAAKARARGAARGR